MKTIKELEALQKDSSPNDHVGMYGLECMKEALKDVLGLIDELDKTDMNVITKWNELKARITGD